MSGRQVGGRYLLKQKIAGGGMGAIWSAHDPQLQRDVAIKLTTSQRISTEGARLQFEKEAKAIAQFSHPNVVQIHDFGFDKDEPFIVMELLEGEDLETRLKRREKLPPSQVASLLTQVARALAAAHSVGIIHRDLKPANLFLTSIDRQEVVKILDFGLVRRKSPTPEVTPESMDGMVGTLRYMSPEQIRGDASLDHRSDLWSISVVIYRALTGKFPFPLESVGGLLNGSFHPPDIAPSTYVPELGPELDRFFTRALNADPEKRFQSAQELAGTFASIVQAARPQAAKILVADDEPDVAVLLRQAFRRQIRDNVYQFLFASDGEDALDQLRQNPDVDVVLTDINMPRMDGLTFLSHVGDVNPLVKVIIVSAYSDMANIRTAMNRGAHDFLTKPLDFQDLEATLSKTLKHVAEARQRMRSIEENALLRILIHSSLLERLRPLMQGPGALVGERADATVVYLRIPDFTTLVRQLPPDAVIQRLNDHFQAIIPELTSRKGLVDRLMGDSAMVVFRGDEHLRQALDGCMAVRQRLKELAATAGAQSTYSQGICIGVDSGEVVVGGVGGPELGRLDYAMVGLPVDNAGRLADMAVSGEVLISDRMCQRVRLDFECRPAGERKLPSLREPLAVHDVVSRRTGFLTSSRAPASSSSSNSNQETPQLGAALSAQSVW